ncbi:ubiquitin-conjugating enzyme E2 D4-like [Drosophila obscura]|uniref:ubiquitin-conjugating enzyme E2 D4-like n=1 Tax=Drosophila obscura TaxID=7282 RepID=UPI001BB245A6|nr:ubiquitin-conjugating enzyme E2 D4-like [Drosophila obscura]
MPPREKVREIDCAVSEFELEPELEADLGPIPVPRPIIDIAKYTRRIIREFIAITRNPLVGCHADIVRGDIRHWVATILGPSDTPYAGGQFHLDIRFSEEYPFLPPRVIFTTKIYHCNVDEFGSITLEILGEHWSPVTRIEHVFVAIQLLLENPKPYRSFDSIISTMLIINPEEHDRLAREWTALYAQPANII